MEPQYEEFIGSGATQQHQDTDKTGMEHFLLANDALRAVDNFNVEKRRRIELPGWAVYRPTFRTWDDALDRNFRG